ncbi:MAG: DUF2846 domain-containing protein [Proteobacteria bacterium]|nr:DUF2846 domain-containing protein [Pseudomonadota bacterium]
MKAWGRIVALSVFALLLASCATTGQKFADSQSAAQGPAKLDPALGRIYFYRTMLLGAAVQPEVKVNGEVVGRAVPNGYFYVDRKPGTYVVSTNTEVERTLSLTLEPGQIRYVKLNLGMGFFVGHVYPELIDPAVAEKEMADTRAVTP